MAKLFSKADGLLSDTVIEFVMLNGKIADLSVPTIGNMCLATNVQDRI